MPHVLPGGAAYRCGRTMYNTSINHHYVIYFLERRPFICRVVHLKTVWNPRCLCSLYVIPPIIDRLHYPVVAAIIAFFSIPILE